MVATIENPTLSDADVARYSTEIRDALKGSGIKTLARLAKEEKLEGFEKAAFNRLLGDFIENNGATVTSLERNDEKIDTGSRSFKRVQEGILEAVRSDSDLQPLLAEKPKSNAVETAKDVLGELNRLKLIKEGSSAHKLHAMLLTSEAIAGMFGINLGEKLDETINKAFGSEEAQGNISTLLKTHTEAAGKAVLPIVETLAETVRNIPGVGNIMDSLGAGALISSLLGGEAKAPGDIPNARSNGIELG